MSNTQTSVSSKLEIAIAARTTAEQHLSSALAAKIAADDAPAHASADQRDAFAKTADELALVLRNAADAAFTASQAVTAILVHGARGQTP
jgi:hypothetical protein